jgi:hypothetical protein
MLVLVLNPDIEDEFKQAQNTIGDEYPDFPSYLVESYKTTFNHGCRGTALLPTYNSPTSMSYMMNYPVVEVVEKREKIRERKIRFHQVLVWVRFSAIGDASSPDIILLCPDNMLFPKLHEYYTKKHYRRERLGRCPLWIFHDLIPQHDTWQQAWTQFRGYISQEIGFVLEAIERPLHIQRIKRHHQNRQETIAIKEDIRIMLKVTEAMRDVLSKMKYAEVNNNPQTKDLDRIDERLGSTFRELTLVQESAEVILAQQNNLFDLESALQLSCQTGD